MKYPLIPVVLCLASVAGPLHADMLGGIDVGTSPGWHFESETHPDGSRSVNLVFQTVAGVDYRVETSTDLQSWQAEDEDHWYGLGQDIVVPMVQTLPPATPPDPPVGDPPAPAIPASLVMHAAATGGGLVLGWRSLDDGSPARHQFSTLTPDSAWTGMPLYAARCGGHAFFIFSPGATAEPPAEAQIHGAADTAMLADFETHFAAMNQSVIDALAQARLAPPPAPPAEGSRKFWRIHADWGLDTDMDGSADHAEFAMPPAPRRAAPTPWPTP